MLDKQTFEEHIARIVKSHPELIEGMQIQNPKTLDEAKKSCHAAVGLYEAILNENKSTSANILRFMMKN